VVVYLFVKGSICFHEQSFPVGKIEFAKTLFSRTHFVFDQQCRYVDQGDPVAAPDSDGDGISIGREADFGEGVTRPGDRNPGRDAQGLNIDGKEFTAQLADAVYPVTGGVMDKMTRTSRRGSHFPRKCYFFTRRGFPLFCITQGIALP